MYLGRRSAGIFKSASSQTPQNQLPSAALNKTSAKPAAICTARMVQRALSRTLSLLAAAIVVHLIVMTSVAEKEGGPAPEASLQRVARSYEGHKHHGSGESSNLLHLVPGGNIFTTENSTVVTAQTAGTTVLPCVVKKFGSGVVSWIRRKDYHLLTVGLATYSSDDRFLIVHARHLQNWGLQIKFVQPRDAGLYECQVSTHPPTSIFVELKVIEAIAEISGAPDLHIKNGSTLRLVCTLRQSTEPPVFVFWYHDDRMINYDKERGVAVHSDRSSSSLVISIASKADSGNYSCVPSNAKPASINVHVLNGEKPAAMQHERRSSSPPSITSNHLLVWSSCLVMLWMCSSFPGTSHRNLVLAPR